MPFDITIATDSFTSCHHSDYHLLSYNEGYEQLYDLFGSLGKVFSFIASDVRDKIDILQTFCDGEQKDNYTTVEGMMLHEIAVTKASPGTVLLGSRTLLRLHRALKFTMLLLERLSNVTDDHSVGSLASSSYSESLAAFHPWVVRQPAKLAMYTLGNKKGFLQCICPNLNIPSVEINEKLKLLVDALRPVYEGCEALYTKHDLHGLP